MNYSFKIIKKIMKDFKIKKVGKYYDVIYIGFPSPNVTFDVHVRSNVFHSKRNEVEAFINYVRDIEKLMAKLKTKHNIRKIIAYYIRQIDSISSGLDVRSTWSKEEFAEILVKWFTEKYNEAEEFCKSTLEWIKSNECNYYTDWSRFDKYNYTNKIFELGLPELDSSYEGFGQDPLERALELSTQLLAKVSEEIEDFTKDKK